MAQKRIGPPPQNGAVDEQVWTETVWLLHVERLGVLVLFGRAVDEALTCFQGCLSFEDPFLVLLFRGRGGSVDLSYPFLVKTSWMPIGLLEPAESALGSLFAGGGPVFWWRLKLQTTQTLVDFKNPISW